MYVGPRVMYHYSCQIATKLEFSQQIIEKNTHISNFMKICPLGAETDRQTETRKLIIPFLNLANSPKIRNTKVITVFFYHCRLFIFLFIVNTTSIRARVDIGEEFLSVTASGPQKSGRKRNQNIGTCFNNGMAG